MKKLFSVRTLILAGSLLLQLSTLCLHSRGAAGDVDLSFDPGLGVNGPVRAVAVQPDGKVIIGGQFTTVKGLVRTNLARLNADGSGDATFNPGLANESVSSLALQSDGKVIVSGLLSTGGECDEFACWTSSELFVIRLNADGSVDNSFIRPTGAESYDASCVAVQSDGKVLVGGDFSTINGTNRSRIARLNANGTLDTSFNPGLVVNGTVRSIALQSDGRVLIAGYFFNGIARLNANGTLDGGFNPVTSALITSVAVQSDGKLLIGGRGFTVNGTNRHGIARLNANGSLDSSFNAGTGEIDSVSSITMQADGKILLSGWFNDVPKPHGVARLNANGSLDSGFDWGAVVSGAGPLVLQPDGKMFIVGNFFTVNDVQRSSIAKLNADGTLDASFQPGKRLDISFSRLIALSDGKVLIGGASTFVLGMNQIGSVRLNANGSLDSSFISPNFLPDLGFPPIPGYTSSTEVMAVAGQTNGKVLIAGYHIDEVCDDLCVTYYNLFIDRFNADGSRDTNFERTVGGTIMSPWSAENVRALAVQPDGRIVVGGYFNSFKGTNRKGLARLNADGSLDSTFNPISGVYGPASITSQPDGKVLIGGGIQNGIARLNANGSLDSSFNPGSGVSGGSVSSVALQPDGKLFIGGDFTAINGTNRNRIARLNANGSLDTSFNPGTGANGNISSIALQPDGNVLISGDFTTVNAVVRPHVARLYGDSVAPSLNIARSNAFVSVSWPAIGLNFQLQETTDFSHPNSWSPVAESAVTNAGQISMTVPSTVGRKFFRLKSESE